MSRQRAQTAPDLYIPSPSASSQARFISLLNEVRLGGIFMLLNALNIKKEYGIQTVLDIENWKSGMGTGLGSSDATEPGNPPF